MAQQASGPAAAPAVGAPGPWRPAVEEARLPAQAAVAAGRRTAEADSRDTGPAGAADIQDRRRREVADNRGTVVADSRDKPDSCRKESVAEGDTQDREAAPAGKGAPEVPAPQRRGPPERRTPPPGCSPDTPYTQEELRAHTAGRST